MRSHPCCRSTSRPSKTPNSWPREVESPEAILRNGRSRAILGAARRGTTGPARGDRRFEAGASCVEPSGISPYSSPRCSSHLHTPGPGRRPRPRSPGALRRGLRPGREVGGALGGDRVDPGVARARAGAGDPRRRRKAGAGRAQPRSTLRTAALPGGPALEQCERIVFRVDAESATPAQPIVLEVRFLAAGRRAWWWRKVELDRPGWREVDLPLAYFRPGGGMPAWEEVDRLGFFFRTGATLELDGIELRRGRARRPPTCPSRS